MIIIFHIKHKKLNINQNSNIFTILELLSLCFTYRFNNDFTYANTILSLDTNLLGKIKNCLDSLKIQNRLIDFMLSENFNKNIEMGRFDINKLLELKLKGFLYFKSNIYFEDNIDLYYYNNIDSIPIVFTIEYYDRYKPMFSPQDMFDGLLFTNKSVKDFNSIITIDDFFLQKDFNLVNNLTDFDIVKILEEYDNIIMPKKLRC